MNQARINLEYREYKKRLARERLLVQRICALTDPQQVKVLAFIEHLELETKPKKPIEYE